MLTRLRRQRDDRGLTLVELLVAMSILTIFFAVFSSVAVRLFDSSRSQQGRSDNLDSNRNVVEVLDRQVRYANAINPPGTVGGSTYVDWRAGSKGQQQTCYQWRVTAAGLMQWRSWLPPYTSGGYTGLTSWSTVGNGIAAVAPDSLFSLTAPVATAGLNRQQLTVAFGTTHGFPAVTTPTRVAFTALNSRTSSTPSTPVCQEVPRP